MNQDYKMLMVICNRKYELMCTKYKIMYLQYLLGSWLRGPSRDKALENDL